MSDYKGQALGTIGHLGRLVSMKLKTIQAVGKEVYS